MDYTAVLITQGVLLEREWALMFNAMLIKRVPGHVPYFQGSIKIVIKTPTEYKWI